MLFDTDYAGSGTYLPELPDPEHCNAHCTALYELHLSKVSGFFMLKSVSISSISQVIWAMEMSIIMPTVLHSMSFFLCITPIFYKSVRCHFLRYQSVINLWHRAAYHWSKFFLLSYLCYWGDCCIYFSLYCSFHCTLWAPPLWWKWHFFRYESGIA